MARALDADESFRLPGVEMRQRFAECGGERSGYQPFGRDAQSRFSEAIRFMGGSFETGSLRISRRARHHYLHGMARMQQGRESVGRGEESVLRDQADERF